MNGIHPTTRNAIDRAVGAGSAVNASLNGGVLDETALSRYVLALSELRLPHEWAAVRARAFEVLQGSSEKIQTIDNLQAYWRESRNGRRVGSDFEKLARNYISAFTGAMNEALQEQGFSGQFSQPSFSLFEKDGMPGRGGYQAKDQLIYQTYDYPGFANAVYGINWLTHEAEHHVQYQIIAAAHDGGLDTAAPWLMETAAIFDWRRDMLRSDADSPRNSLARACYMLMPTELDAMLAGDTAANSFATVKDPRQLTSHLNNPEAGQSLDLTLLQAREIVGAKYSQSIPKSANAFEL